MEDAFEIFSLAHSLRSLKEKLGDQACHNDEYIEMAVRCADKLACHFSNACDPSEVEPLVPESARTQEVANAYRQRGANAMADLCARLA